MAKSTRHTTMERVTRNPRELAVAATPLATAVVIPLFVIRADATEPAAGWTAAAAANCAVLKRGDLV